MSVSVIPLRRGRTILELHSFTREDINYILQQHAKMMIVGGFYVGEIGKQSIAWAEDGSATVTTEHAPARS